MKTRILMIAFLALTLFLQACLKDDSHTVTTSKVELLTHHPWKIEELTQVENNVQINYKRGGSANTHNFDEDKLTFLEDGTGSYSPTPSESFGITWEFTNAEKTRMDIVITFTPALITTLRCSEVEITERRFFCVMNYSNASGQPVLGTVYRTPL